MDIVYAMLLKTMSTKENVRRIVKIQSFIRGAQKRKRYKKLLVIARKVIKLAEVLDSVNS